MVATVAVIAAIAGKDLRLSAFQFASKGKAAVRNIRFQSQALQEIQVPVDQSPFLAAGPSFELAFTSGGGEAVGMRFNPAECDGLACSREVAAAAGEVFVKPAREIVRDAHVESAVNAFKDVDVIRRRVREGFHIVSDTNPKNLFVSSTGFDFGPLRVPALSLVRLAPF